MAPLVIIDTSLWTHALRKSGAAEYKRRVENLLDERRAAWCEIIRLELWAGVGKADERARLSELDETLPRIPITDEVWEDAAALAAEGRLRGLRFPAADILIFACARRHKISIERVDNHYDLLELL